MDKHEDEDDSKAVVERAELGLCVCVSACARGSLAGWAGSESEQGAGPRQPASVFVFLLHFLRVGIGTVDNK